MNSISISGNLGKDAERRALGDGTAVLSFSVADSQGREKPTIWWNCSIFGKRADALEQYLTKGQVVTVAGSVSEREYTDKDGHKRKSLDVRVNDIALQGGKKEEAPQGRQSAPLKPSPKNEDFGDDSASEIPF
jgi:single-strand DNA-binding protein